MDTAAIPSASPEPARRGPALLIVAALLCAIVIVDPVREFMSQDDGWAYARSVEHLLRTGEYRLDAWSAANLPVQIYLAAGLAEMFGYSLSLLRASTLLLLAAGLAALYGLLRRGSLPAWPAAVLTLGFLASPLVLMLSFTFMSDIQFTGWLLIALWLYSRGFESGSDRDLLLGSAAAACAIGTRQFGMALIAGVVVAWVVSRPAKRPPLRSLLLALALPLAVSAWQLRAGLATPNFTQAVRLHEQAYFLTMPPSVMAHEIGWRLSTVLQYLGLSLLPVLPLLASLCLTRASRRDGPPAAGTTRVASSSQRSSKVIAMLALLTLAGLLLFSLKNSDISTRANGSHLLLLPWMLPTAFWSMTWLMLGFAASGVVGAFFLLLLFWRWQGTRPRVRDLPWQALLTAATGLILVALHLSYVQLNDTYLVGMLPFVLLLVGARPGDSAPRHAGAGRHGSVVVRDARGTECVDAWRLQPSAGPMGQCRPAGCVWHTAALHWRNPPLVGVSRCLRRVAGRDASRLRPSARRSLSRPTGPDARSLLRLDGGPVTEWHVSVDFRVQRGSGSRLEGRR